MMAWRNWRRTCTNTSTKKTMCSSPKCLPSPQKSQEEHKRCSMRRRKKCNPQFKLSVPNTEPKRSRSTQPDIAHSDHVLALELTPLGTLCRWLEDQQRVCLRRDLAHLERLIRLMPPDDGKNRQQLVKIRTAILSFQRKFAAHLKTEAKVVFPLNRQMESNLVGDPHASRSLQTPTTPLERQ